MTRLKYIDTREIYIPRLKHYKGGVSLPNGKDNVIEVSETEKVWLLKQKNGNNPCFEEFEKRTISREKTIKEEDNGDR